MAIIVIALLVTMSPASGYVVQDPGVEACKDYTQGLNIEVKVEGKEVWIADCYELMNQAGLSSEPVLSIATLSTPTEVVMTARFPRNTRFFPVLNQDGSQRNYEVKVLSEDENYRTLEYKLKELGLWSFVAEGLYMERFSFQLLGVQMQAGQAVNTGYGGQQQQQLDIRLLKKDGGYGDGDFAEFDGQDVGNPNVVIQYAGAEYPPSQGIRVDADNTRVVAVDESGAKQSASMYIQVKPAMASQLAAGIKGYWYFIAIALALGIVVVVAMGRSNRRRRAWKR